MWARTLAGSVLGRALRAMSCAALAVALTAGATPGTPAPNEPESASSGEAVTATLAPEEPDDQPAPGTVEVTPSAPTLVEPESAGGTGEIGTELAPRETDGQQASVTVDTQLPSEEPDPIVTVRPDGGQPGDRVIVSITFRGTGWFLDSCTAGFIGKSPSSCAPVGPAGVVTLQVPSDTGPGKTWIKWDATWSTKSGHTWPEHGGKEFTVLRPDDTFSAEARPGSGRPGDSITLTLTATLPDVTVDSCTAAFDVAPQATDCRPSGSSASVALRVPRNAGPGTTSISWKVVFHVDNGAEELVTRSTPFNVDPAQSSGVNASSTGASPGTTGADSSASGSPDQRPAEQRPTDTVVPEPTPAGSGPGTAGPLALVLLLAGLTFLVRRRVAAGRREQVSTSQHRVQAVAGPRTDPEIEFREIGPGRSRALGVQPRTAPVTVSIREATDA